MILKLALNAVGSFLGKYLKEIIMVLVVGAVLLHHHNVIEDRQELSVEVASLKKDLKTAEGVNEKLLETKGKLEKAVEEQNTSIRALTTEREELTARLNKVLNDMRQRDEDAAGKISDIATTDVPRTCQGAFEWYFDELQKEGN